MRKVFGWMALTFVATAVLTVAWMDFGHRHPDSPFLAWLGRSQPAAATEHPSTAMPRYPIGSILSDHAEPNVLPVQDLPHLIHELRALSGLQSEAVPDALEVKTAHYEEQEDPSLLALVAQGSARTPPTWLPADGASSSAMPMVGHFFPHLPVVLAMLEDIRGDVLFHLAEPVTLEDTLTCPRANVSEPKVLFASRTEKACPVMDDADGCSSPCQLCAKMPAWIKNSARSMSGFFHHLGCGEIKVDVNIQTQGTEDGKPHGTLTIGMKIDAKAKKGKAVQQAACTPADGATCTSSCSKPSAGCCSAPCGSGEACCPSKGKGQGCPSSACGESKKGCSQTTSTTSAPHERIRFYPVAGLINEHYSAQILIQMLQNMVAPQCWQDGWQGVGEHRPCIFYFPPGECLIVRQTPEVHEEIAFFLRQLLMQVEGTALRRHAPSHGMAEPMVMPWTSCSETPRQCESTCTTWIVPSSNDKSMHPTFSNTITVGCQPTCVTVKRVSLAVAPCHAEPSCSVMTWAAPCALPASGTSSWSSMGPVQASGCQTAWIWVKDCANDVTFDPSRFDSNVAQTSMRTTNPWKRAAMRTYWIYQNDPRSSQVVPAHLPAEEQRPVKNGD